MKLIDIIPFINYSIRIDDLISYLNIQAEATDIYIYMKDRIDINNELTFFTLNKIDGRMYSKKDGIDYVQLFDLYTLTEVVEDLNLVAKGYDDLTIAKRLIEYRVNDA